MTARSGIATGSRRASGRSTCFWEASTTRPPSGRTPADRLERAAVLETGGIRSDRGAAGWREHDRYPDHAQSVAEELGVGGLFRPSFLFTGPKPEDVISP